MLEKKKKSYVNPAGLYVRVAGVLSAIALLSGLRPSGGGGPGGRRGRPGGPVVPGPAPTGLRWLPLARSPRPCFLPLSLCISCPICPACPVGSCPDFESTSTQAHFPLSRLPATGTFCAADISHRRAVSFTCLSLPGPRELFEKRDAGRPHLCGSGAWCIARTQRVRNV